MRLRSLSSECRINLRTDTRGGSLVILDRDGVLNYLVEHDGTLVAPRAFSEFRMYDGVGRAVRRLRDSGIALGVATNQPEIARGGLEGHELKLMMRALRREIFVDEVRVCPHQDGDGCACRKPQPGMLLDLMRSCGADSASSVMVGDTWKDIEAGKRAQCATILVSTGSNDSLGADAVVRSLSEAADLILAGFGQSKRPLGGR